MKKYLSIGDVAKLKGVSIKSLRYYDDIGVLKPAWINPKTKYRYYTPNQLAILDIIIICLELGIPLKSFANYKMVDGTISLEALLKDGQELANQKTKAIYEMVKRLAAIVYHVQEHAEIHDKTGFYKRNFHERTFLLASWNRDQHDDLNYQQMVTELHTKARANNILSLAQSGIIFLYRNNNIASYVFIHVETQNSEKCDGLITIPSGSFDCMLFQEEQVNKAYEYALENKRPIPTAVILSEVFDVHQSVDSYIIEMQIVDF